jgi:hypothetical protein
MDDAALSIDELIDEIRRNGWRKNGKRASELGVALAPAPSLRASRELEYLNRGWVLEGGIESRRLGVFTVLRRTLVPRFVRSWIRGMLTRVVVSVLEPYLLEERAFLERLVRLQNELARRGDELADETRALAAATDGLGRWLDGTYAHLVAHDELLHAQAERRLERLERLLRAGS